LHPVDGTPLDVSSAAATTLVEAAHPFGRSAARMRGEAAGNESSAAFASYRLPLNASELDAVGVRIVTTPTPAPPDECRLLCCVLSADGREALPCADAPLPNVTDVSGGENGSDAASSDAASSEHGDPALFSDAKPPPDAPPPDAPSPPAPPPGAFPDGPCAVCFSRLSLALNAIDFEVPTKPHSAGDAPHTFAFYNASALTISKVEPRSGPAHGGTIVTIRGSGLAPAGSAAEDARCGFGSKVEGSDDGDGSVQPLQSTSVLRADPFGRWLVCAPTAPFNGSFLGLDGEEGPPAVPLLVSIAPNGVDFERSASAAAESSSSPNSTAEATAFDAFHVYPEPLPASLVPSGGPISGGTSVRVRGGGLAQAITPTPRSLAADSPTRSSSA
jgi:hypothetical protein